MCLDGIAVSKCVYSYETNFAVNVTLDILSIRMVGIAMVGDEFRTECLFTCCFFR